MLYGKTVRNLSLHKTAKPVCTKPPNQFAQNVQTIVTENTPENTAILSLHFAGTTAIPGSDSVIDSPIPQKPMPESERLANAYFELFVGSIPNDGVFRQVQGQLARLIGRGVGRPPKGAPRRVYSPSDVLGCMRCLSSCGVTVSSAQVIGLVIDSYLADNEDWPPAWLKPARIRASARERVKQEWSVMATAASLKEEL